SGTELAGITWQVLTRERLDHPSEVEGASGPASEGIATAPKARAPASPTAPALPALEDDWTSLERRAYPSKWNFILGGLFAAVAVGAAVPAVMELAKRNEPINCDADGRCTALYRPNKAITIPLLSASVLSLGTSLVMFAGQPITVTLRSSREEAGI